MKKVFGLSLLFVSVISLSSASPFLADNTEKDFAKYVNPFNGTDFHGHTFPGAVYPFGMIQLSPDTRLTGWDGCSGYHYSDSVIYGFSHTHLSGTGASDYGDILVMPVDGYRLTLGIDKEQYKSAFSHKRESASPGYYKVFLDKWGVEAELTTGKRAAMHQYTFTKRSSEPGLIIDLTHRDFVIDSEIRIVDKKTIEGYRRSSMWATDQIVYFHIEFSSPANAIMFLNGENRGSSGSIRGGDCKLFLSFENSVKRVSARIGISSVSTENAALNLHSEVNDWDFDKLKRGSRAAWNEFLSRIVVEKSGGKEAIDLKKTFYTALYHSAIHPSLYSDINGEYRGMDRKVHKAQDYEQYTVFSLWDTFRALHPLLTIIDEKRTNNFINSFLSIYRESGKLPIWELSGCETDCMIAYHSVPVIADAYLKGIRKFDAKYALEAMVASSNKKEYGKEYYLQYGYLPADKEHESVSKTLEYSFDDWTISQLARALGNREVYSRYIERAQYYRNIFDPSTGFMRPKSNGAWVTPFSSTEVNNHFTEANSWQYSFFVPQDINGHILLLGGDEKYSTKLDELFSASSQTTGRTQADITGMVGQYAHGNEPSQHIAYLYNYVGKPWKTQEMVNKIATSLYSWTPEGICGNDDCGQTSAWFVMSAMGFYQVTPGNPQYIIGSPMFDKVTVKLENGKSFIIETKLNHINGREVSIAGKTEKKPIYIQSALLNGQPYTKSWFSHQTILDGSKLEFEMGTNPNEGYGSSPADRPVSRIDSGAAGFGEALKFEQIVENVSFEYPAKVFSDSTTVTITPAAPGDAIWYRTTGHAGFSLYKEPVKLKESTTIEAFSTRGNRSSCIIPAELIKVTKNRKIEIFSKYNRQYTAGGDEGIIDGLRGDVNFRLGGWQGYQDTDFEAVVDLGSEKNITTLGAGFLQDARSWIWMPKFVEFSVSADGKVFEKVGRIENQVAENDMLVQVKDMILNIVKDRVRYVKIFAKNIGTIPQWHPGAGDQGFIFIDEIFTEN